MKGLQNYGGGSKKKTRGGTFGKLHIQGQGNPRGNDNCPAAPTLKHEGNQLVNNTNHNYEKLDIKEEDMLFLYTNADCLPNKLFYYIKTINSSPGKKAQIS